MTWSDPLLQGVGGFQLGGKVKYITAYFNVVQKRDSQAARDSMKSGKELLGMREMVGAAQ